MGLICVEGNIGSGKSSLAGALAASLKLPLLREEFEENPFLPLFYQDHAKYAFPLEFSFLLDRARQLAALREELGKKMYIADYYIEKCLWFAQKNLHADEFAIFQKSYPSVASLAPKPELIIFLHLPLELLRQNIAARGREMEQQIDPEYLKGMNFLYSEKSMEIRNDVRIMNFRLNSNSTHAYAQVFNDAVEAINSGIERMDAVTEVVIN